MPATLRAYDALTMTEIRPGDRIRSLSTGMTYTFRSAIRATTATRDGSIEIDGPPGQTRYHAGLFGVHVMLAEDYEPNWESSMTMEPGDIQRDIRGPGGFWALVGPDADGRWDWSVIDRSDGETVTSGKRDSQEDARQAVLDWEREHGLIPEAGTLPAPSGQPETTLTERLAAAVTRLDGDYEPSVQPEQPVRNRRTGALAVITALHPGGRVDIRYTSGDNKGKTLSCVGRELFEDWEAVSPDTPEADLSRPLREILDDLDAAAGTRRAATLRRELEAAVRAQVDPLPDGVAGDLAAEAERAAQTMAPPMPGVTRNGGSVVYAVLPASPGRWWVAARRESDGERVTWFAETCPGGTLAYNAGHYHTDGPGSEDETLVDLAVRAGVLARLTGLASGIATREAYRESHAAVLEELSGVHGVGRAKVRSGLLEAAALGYTRISWHDRGTRSDYGIHYDRYRCTFSWTRER